MCDTDIQKEEYPIVVLEGYVQEIEYGNFTAGMLTKTHNGTDVAHQVGTYE